MCRTNTTSWIEKVLTELRALAPHGGAGALEEAWAEHAAKALPVLTLYGSYDSGKSSLLKRLLLDEGREVPKWLTISARHETFEVHEAEAFGWVIRDTPGISAGSRAREAVATEALRSSDGFLVVLPPQLATSELSDLLALLTGQLFHPRGCGFPRGSLFVVVSRMDEAGGDPLVDLRDYESVLQEKRRELMALLKRHAAPADGVEIHLVAPDAFQLVGNRADATRASYDATRAWDAVEALERALLDASRRGRELREAARFRFFLAAADRARAGVAGELATRRLDLGEAESGLARCRLAQERLAALLGAAETSLTSLVEEEVLHLVRSGFHSDPARELRARLHRALERWEARHDELLENLAEDLGAQREARRAGTGGSPRRFSDPLNAGLAHGSAGPVPSPGGLMVEAAVAARWLARANAGLTWVRQVSEAGAHLRSARKVESCSKSNHRSAVTHALGVLLELVPLFVLPQAAAAEQEGLSGNGDRGLALRDQARNAAASFVRNYFEGGAGQTGWRARPDAMGQVLAERIRLAEARRRAASCEMRLLEGRLAVLAALLEEAETIPFVP